MKPKIMVIDDNREIAEAIEVILSEEGYEVVTCTFPENAVTEIKNHLPNLVLIDVLMSGIDGREVCVEVKKDPITKDCKIVMISAHPTARLQFSSYGADDFLAKPFTLESLLQVVEKHTN